MATKVILRDGFLLDDLTIGQEFGGAGALVRRGALVPGTLQVQQGSGGGTEDRSILLKFDLRTIPVNARVVSAQLNLWLESADNVLFTSPMRRVVYRLLDTLFDEDTASWTNRFQAANGQSTLGDFSWGTPGARGPGVDREFSPVYDETEALTIPHTYYSFEVGPAVERGLVAGVVGLLYERSTSDPLDVNLETYRSREGARSANREFGSQTAPFLVVEYEPVVEETPMTIPRFDYTDRDYQGVRAAYLRHIPITNPDWTDLNPTNPGITLAELSAIAADQGHYHLDRAFNERFPDFMTLRSSLNNVAKLVGATLDPASPARVELLLTLNAVAVADTTIPEGSQFSGALSDGSTVTFETDADLVIPIGQISGKIAATEGTTITEDPVPGVVSNGTPFQEVRLSNADYLAGSLEVTVLDGSGSPPLWTLVDSLAAQSSTAEVFELVLDEDDVPGFRFGDNLEGAIPPVGAQFRATYRTGGGDRGNVVPGGIDTAVSAGLPAGLVVTNPLAASGGGARQSLEAGRTQVFKSVRTNTRVVTLRDFGDAALSVEGVGKAAARRNPDTIDPSDVEVIIAPTGGGQPTQALVDAVVQEIEGRKLEGVSFAVVGFSSVRVNFTASIRIGSSFQRRQGEELTREELRRQFGFEGRDFGETLRLSQINQIVENVTPVDFVEIERFSRVPEAVLHGWVGNASFTSVAISASTKNEEFEIVLLSPVTFRVTGSVSGVQSAVGTFDQLYTTDGGEAAFTVLSGSEPNAAGDRATFVTSPLVASVALAANELAERGQLRLTFSGGLV